MKAAEIEDFDGLEAWLKEQPVEASAWIASRAAARVVPVFWEFAVTFSDSGVTALPILRAVLISYERVFSADPEIRSAAARALRLGAAIRIGADRGAHTAAAAARAAYCAASTAATGDAVRSVVRAVHDATDAVGIVSNAVVLADARAWDEVGVAVVALWHDEGSANPDVWAEVQRALPRPDPGRHEETARGPGPEVADYHGFWVPWYQGLLDGKPAFDPKLIREVALIAREDWDKGDVHINNRVIPELMRKYARAAAQGGERIGVDAARQFYAEPVTELPEDIRREAGERIAEAVEDFRARMARSNVLTLLAAEVDGLERLPGRFGNRPMRFYEKLADARDEIEARAREAGLEGEGPVQTLLREIERSRIDLRAGDAVIEARMRGRFRVGFDELGEGQKTAWLEAIREGAEASEPGLRSEMEEDIPIIADWDAPQEARGRAIRREAERTVQMREHILRGAEDVTKTTKAFSNAWEVLKTIYGWFG